MEYNPFSLTGKTILVTGASSGIGKEIAIACSKMGATLILSGRNEVRLKETQSLLQGEVHEIIQCDNQNETEINQLAQKVGLLDGIVYCAGIRSLVPCKMVRMEDIQSMMNVNFTGPVLLQTALLKNKKIKKGASIVFISSRASEIPAKGNAIYSATKAALQSYAKCLALELSAKSIRVNCVRPGMVNTNLINDGSLTEEQLSLIAEKYPLKRLGEPKDIAHICLYLLSDASSWVTGVSYDISGGGEGILTI